MENKLNVTYIKKKKLFIVGKELIGPFRRIDSTEVIG